MVQSDLVVPSGETVTSTRDIVRRSASPGGGYPGVPRSVGRPAHGAAGRVLLVLDAQWSGMEVAEFLARNGVSKSAVSELAYAVNGFYIETDAGLESLSLANRLAGQNGVRAVQPELVAGGGLGMRAGLVQGRARLWIPALAAAVLCMLAAAQFAAAQAPGPATISAVVAGDGSLTVVWDPPAGTSGSDVTAYDVRYIATSADETVDSNWELVSSAWTSGPRRYMIDGLTNGTSYDVEVRAVTTTAGEWSATCGADAR